MKKNRHKKLRSIRALMLALILTATMGIRLPQEAFAAGGDITVSLAKVKGLNENTEFTFEMYKAGHFSGPDIELEAALKDAGVDVDFATGKDESDGAKAERMLKSAKALTQYIDDNGIEPELIGTHTLKAGESFTQSVTENGLYLVRSHPVRDASDGAKYNWTPQPVYVAVIDGDTSIELANKVLDSKAVIKIVRTPVPLQHMVIKSWVIPEGSGDVKPDSITVNIRYGGEIIDTVELTADDNWSYTWESEEAEDKYKYIGSDGVISFKPNLDDPHWTCDEEDVENFSVEYADPKIINPDADIEDQQAVYEITNTYEPPETPPTPPDTPPTPPKPPHKPDTGDTNNIIGWAAALAAACVLLVILYIRRRKNRDDIR